MTVILYFILAMQIGFLVVTNLSQLQLYLGYDASAVYLQAQMIWEQQTLLIKDWIYTSTLTWDTPMLLAIPLFDWTGDIFLSFGISILLSLVVLMWVGNGLLDQLGASKRAKLLCAIFFLTPYASYPDAFNRIDYYGVMLSIFGVYSWKTTLMMALWWMFFYLDRKQTTLPQPKSSQLQVKIPELGNSNFLMKNQTLESSKISENDQKNTEIDQKSPKMNENEGLYQNQSETDQNQSKTKKKWRFWNETCEISLRIVVILLFSFLTAVSSGYHVLLYGVLPPLAYAILRNTQKDSWKKENIRAIAFLLAVSFVSYVGKGVQTQLLHTPSHETQLGWVSISNFWTNLGSIFQGYLEFTGALPLLSSPPIFEPEGYFFVCFLIISFGLLISSVDFLQKTFKNPHDGAKKYYSAIFSSMLLIFVFVYTTYGAAIFEVRYLIPNFILLIMFSALWLDKELSSINKSWQILLQILVIPSIFVVNLVSQDMIEESQNAYDLKTEVIQYLEPHESPVVFFAGLDTIAFGKNMRVFDREKAYLWSNDCLSFSFLGDYTYFTENSDYSGVTPLIMSPRDFEELPQQFQNVFQKTHDFSSFLAVYEAGYNPFDLTPGITFNDYNRDYTYTPGLNLDEEVEFPESAAVRVLGTGGYVLRGPNLEVPGHELPTNIYDLTVHYRVISALYPEHIGVFEFMVTEDAETILASEKLTYEGSSVTLKNVDLTDYEGAMYEYRLLVNGGAEIDIYHIDIRRSYKPGEKIGGYFTNTGVSKIINRT